MMTNKSIMGIPISIQLDDDVRLELEGQALSRGIGLGTLLRELATQAAREARRSRIRTASEIVGQHVAGSVDAQKFYDICGMLNAG